MEGLHSIVDFFSENFFEIINSDAWKSFSLLSIGLIVSCRGDCFANPKQETRNPKSKCKPLPKKSSTDGPCTIGPIPCTILLSPQHFFQFIFLKLPRRLITRKMFRSLGDISRTLPY